MCACFGVVVVWFGGTVFIVSLLFSNILSGETKRFAAVLACILSACTDFKPFSDGLLLEILELSYICYSYMELN